MSFIAEHFAVTRIDSWAQAADVLFDFTYEPKWKRYKGNYVFRGMSNSAYTLSTVLQRTYDSPELNRIEAHLLRHFKNYAHEQVRDPDMSDWKWLALSRHSGLPTRILDWTASPLVALFFACYNVAHHGADGLIWRLDYEQLNKRLPERLKESLGVRSRNVLNLEQLEEAGIFTLAELEQYAERDQPVGFVFEPPSLDDKIIQQDAVMSILSDANLRFDEWLGRHPDLVHVFVIDAGAKRQCANYLRLANISHRTLFPGLEGLAESLKQWYGPWIGEE